MEPIQFDSRLGKSVHLRALLSNSPVLGGSLLPTPVLVTLGEDRVGDSTTPGVKSASEEKKTNMIPN